MRAGALTERLTIRIPVLTPDDYMTETVSYTDHATVWGAAWPVRANERLKNLKLEQDVTMRFRIWYRKPFEADWRIYWRSREYKIVSIIPDEKRVYLDILATDQI